MIHRELRNNIVSAFIFTNKKSCFIFTQIVSDNWYQLMNLLIEMIRKTWQTMKRLTPTTTANATTTICFAAISAKIHAARRSVASTETVAREQPRYHVTTYQRNICLLTERYTTSLSLSLAFHTKPIKARNRRPSTIGRFFEHNGRDAGINALQLLALDLYCPRTCWSLVYRHNASDCQLSHFNKSISDFLWEMRLCSNWKWNNKLFCLRSIFYTSCRFFSTENKSRKHQRIVA